MRLEVGRWHREGFLRPGHAGSWRWTNGDGEVVGSIGYRASEGGVLLDYSVSGRPAGQWVALDRTACHYGGSRPWFRCPACDRRVGLLYMRSGRFACRCCQQVAYRSQSEDACGRTWLRQQKIEAKLAESWGRPKGMHRTTYDRLLSVILACEDERDASLATYLSRFPDLLPG